MCHYMYDPGSYRYCILQVHDKFLDNVIQNLEDRFQDSGVLSHFAQVFDPAKLEVDGEVFFDEDQVDSLKVHKSLY